MKTKTLFIIIIMVGCAMMSSCSMSRVTVKTSYVSNSKYALEEALDYQSKGINIMPYLDIYVDSILYRSMYETSVAIATEQKKELAKGRIKSVNLDFQVKKNEHLIISKRLFKVVMNDMVRYALSQNVADSGQAINFFTVKDYWDSNPKKLERLKKVQEKKIRRAYRRLNKV